jgi:DNA-binding CsgD family transcriptional regulator
MGRGVKGDVAAPSRTAKRAALASTRAARISLTRVARQRDTCEVKKHVVSASTPAWGGPLIAFRGGVLEKRAPRESLFDTVTRALARDSREREARERRRELCARFDTLSERELEVLSHVVQGRLNKQIAWDLGIHERTVKLHRTAITTKLKVPVRGGLMQLVQEAGIFPELIRTFPKGQ